MDYSKALRELFLMQQTYSTLFSVTNKLQMRGDKYMENLTSRQFMTMMSILHLPKEETTLNNIAKMLGTSKQNANILISNIERKGYIITMPCKQDKRAINVEITELGIEVILQCNLKGNSFLSDIFDDFTEKEIENLWNLLKKLYSYDGEKQNGFEENAMEGEDIADDSQMQWLEEFAQRRNKLNEI